VRRESPYSELKFLERDSARHKPWNWTNRKLIIKTLRHCRFGARRCTVLAAVASSLKERQEMNKVTPEF